MKKNFKEKRAKSKKLCRILWWIGFLGTGVFLFPQLKMGNLSIFVIHIFLYTIFFNIFVEHPILKKINAEEFESAPLFTLSAQVISKISYSTGGRNPQTIFSISFEFSDGTRKNFNVNIEDFNLIFEKDEGLLTYKEINDQLIFIRFQRNMSGI